MALMIAGAVKHTGGFFWHLFSRRDEKKLTLIGWLGINLKGLFADGNTRPARQDMVIVVHDLLPGPTIDDRLVTLDARPFLSLVCRQSDGAEFNSFNNPIGFRLKI